MLADRFIGGPACGVGLQAVGMRTVFVTRDGRTSLPGWPDPDLTVSHLGQMTDADMTQRTIDRKAR